VPCPLPPLHHTLLAAGVTRAAGSACAAMVLGAGRRSLKLPALLEGKVTASAGSSGPRAREPAGDRLLSTVAGSALIAAARASSSRCLLRLMTSMASTARRAIITTTATIAPAMMAMLPLPLLVLLVLLELLELLVLPLEELEEERPGGDSLVVGEADAAGMKGNTQSHGAVRGHCAPGLQA
jgi:hypothetical protein